MKQKTESKHKPKLKKSSNEEPSYDYDDDYEDSDGLNSHKQEYFADCLSRQEEQSAQIKQKEQLQHIDHDTPTDEENELVADAADVAEANTTENKDVEPPEPEIQEQLDLVAQSTCLTKK